MKSLTLSRRKVSYGGRALRELMRLMKKVAVRCKGNGYKIRKFHLLTHILEDVMDFGVPQNWNADYNENNHIDIAKKHMHNTQRRKESFTEQCAMRYSEQLTIHQVLSSREFHHMSSKKKEDALSDDTGSKFYVEGNVNKKCSPLIFSSKENEVVSMSTRVLNFITETCPVNETDSLIHCFSDHVRKGQIFRGRPKMGLRKAWHDFVIISWAEHGEQPSLIHCFVHLSKTRDGYFMMDNIRYEEGSYAVVTCFTMDNGFFDDDAPATFDIIGTGRREEEGKLRLVDVESFCSPVVGIPDVKVNGQIDHDTYLFMKTRKKWPDIWRMNIYASYHASDDETVEETNNTCFVDSDDDSESNTNKFYEESEL